MKTTDSKWTYYSLKPLATVLLNNPGLQLRTYKRGAGLDGITELAFTDIDISNKITSIAATCEAQFASSTSTYLTDYKNNVYSWVTCPYYTYPHSTITCNIITM